MNGKLILWGASGHAKVLAECVERLGYETVAVFDNKPGLTSPLKGVPLYTGWEGFLTWRRATPGPVEFLVAIGGARGRDRLDIQARLAREGLVSISVIHPTAFVARSAAIAEGVQVLSNASVGVESRLGTQTIVNTNASVDHECILGRGVHVAPGATLAGRVTIGDGTLIGAGAVVLPQVCVGSDVTVGAGAVVVRDIPDGITVVGNPARPLRAKAA